ncbi:helix-turn-helix domain-containing protein [Clostridium sp. C105KSO13]|uniref:helix-turn-helix domain-containing protein n=1 Tax=Clostridium sp. C105KSO13 TaxID=1776045 RepID=UPI00074075C9|nr:helix-turn-helix transcriptional regulator [Clostridium sp. C105KSO13]CUX51295.1 HTH-type transcriptional regulator ImmR [Clostridium sp. C105KSO13]
MILAEKIMKLRKQNGWSQEELAMKLNISRQSVSKWESTAAIPDLDKIIKLSEIFEVSTDYLLKDELEDEARVGTISDDESDYNNESVRTVSLEDANSYMEMVDGAAKKMAGAVSACILSPVLLILLGGLSEYQETGITEDMAGGVGVTVLLLIIAGAVAVFILIGMQLDKFEYLEKESLNLQYGVAGIAQTKRDYFEPVFKRCIASGVALCIISAVPILIAAAFNPPDMVYVYCVAFLLILIAFAVFLFVWSSMIYGSYQKLLEEGDYTRSKKLENKRNDNLSKVYWCTATAIYLGASFLTRRWEITWVVWPCAGVFYAAVCGIAAMLRKS